MNDPIHVFVHELPPYKFELISFLIESALPVIAAALLSYYLATRTHQQGKIFNLMKELKDEIIKNHSLASGNLTDFHIWLDDVYINGRTTTPITHSQKFVIERIIDNQSDTILELKNIKYNLKYVDKNNRRLLIKRISSFNDVNEQLDVMICEQEKLLKGMCSFRDILTSHSPYIGEGVFLENTYNFTEEYREAYKNIINSLIYI